MIHALHLSLRMLSLSGIDGGIGRYFTCDVSGGQSRSVRNLHNDAVSIFPATAVCSVVATDSDGSGKVLGMQRHVGLR